MAKELGFTKDARRPVLIFDDSEPAIAIASNMGLSNKSRSIRLSYHNVRDCVLKDEVTIAKVKGDLNTVDVFTKILNANKHGRYTNKLLRS